MSTQNTRAVPIRTIIMILISAAISLAAVGIHGLVTRDDDPQAALNAQEAKIKAAATETAQPAADKPPVCLISVARAPVADARDKLTKAGYTVQGEAAAGAVGTGDAHEHADAPRLGLEHLGLKTDLAQLLHDVARGLGLARPAAVPVVGAVDPDELLAQADDLVLGGDLGHARQPTVRRRGRSSARKEA